jgi:DNA uptake protein ComE-like DNA-binding protein
MAKLTLWSRVRNVAADGTARVNLNTASDEALTGLLAEAGVGGELLSAILRSRRQQPFESIGELLTRVYDVTDLGGMPRTIRLGVGEFAAVADRLTVDPNAVLAGRVNVHTARETVLAALPGLDEESARSIVAARANVDQAVFGSAETVAWLLTVLDEETFAACCESLTVRSQQFRCRIVPGANAEDLSRPRRSAALAVLERDGPRVGCIFWRQWRESPPTTDSQ